MDLPLVSIVIPVYNMAHLIRETLWSCVVQDYPNKEIIVYDDCSTDDIRDINFDFYGVKYLRGLVNVGVGNAFNAGMKEAQGEFIILMCADDLFTGSRVITDYVATFLQYPGCGVIARWYHQFVTGDSRPVRAWRTYDLCIQANNPSGLAFRREALNGHGCSNRMFIETSFLVKVITLDLWGHVIIPYDTIAARVHNSTSTTKEYWLKRRVSSPVMDWWGLGVKVMAQDYCSLIQIKNGYFMSAVWEEIWNFIRLRPKNLLNPLFYFYSLLALCVPRGILRKTPDFYRRYIGWRITRKVLRNDIKSGRGKEDLQRLR